MANKELELDGTITITRPQYGDGSELIRIVLTDALSRVKFVAAEMTLDDFTRAITGMAFNPVKFKIDSLDKVGLRKQFQSVVLDLPPRTTKEQAQALLRDDPAYQVEGWTNDTYLGSQRSVETLHDSTRVRFGRYRWVPVEQPVEVADDDQSLRSGLIRAAREGAGDA